MFRQIASVGSLTLLSRISGFIRDIVIASVLGAGWMADAFVVAQRLPNHFRAIFGEGAFNAAFVPAYAKQLEDQGSRAAQLFASSLFRILLGFLSLITILAIVFMPHVVSWLAPGFSADPQKFALAVALTRITFPYLLFISLVTLMSGMLNAHERFASAAFAPVLLNLSIIAALLVGSLFPSTAHAAAWGVFGAGVLELLLVWIAAARINILPSLLATSAEDSHKRAIRGFFKALGPAVVGSAGVQLAMFADTIIASMLPTGAVASLYYADRLYQLPVGMIGIAAGTVLLPAMSRHWAAGQPDRAHLAQNQAMAMTLALSMPFVIAFVLVPDAIMRGLFMRGAFDAAAASNAAAVLAAYTIGLPAVVLIRSAVSSFHARSDTTTPVIASFAGIAVNILLKIMLAQSWGAAGLAFATAIGAWINFGLLVLLALRRGWMVPDSTLGRWLLGIGLSACVMFALLQASLPLVAQWSGQWTSASNEMELAGLAVIGLVAYALPLLVMVKLLRLDPRLTRQTS
jgi:putative peptidoglycan lipid II flippase